MKKPLAFLTFIILTIVVSGCGNGDGNNHPKLDEYVSILAYTEAENHHVTIKYDLKQNLENGIGLTTQNIYFSNGKSNTLLVSNKKGKQEIIIEKLDNEAITLFFNGSNQYVEQMEIN